MKCLKCNIETSNPKFCSRSCAAKFNNTKYPKRLVESKCKRCKSPCSKSRTYCFVCWNIVLSERSIDLWDSTMLKDMKGNGTANNGGRYPYIRTLSRKKYMKSSLPKKCKICNYSLHIEICHIKDINKWDESSLISEVNSLENLVALCRNHHWEFDNGYINI